MIVPPTWIRYTCYLKDDQAKEREEKEGLCACHVEMSRPK